jgi:hypothetical protein
MPGNEPGKEIFYSDNIFLLKPVTQSLCKTNVTSARFGREDENFALTNHKTIADLLLIRLEGDRQ